MLQVVVFAIFALAISALVLISGIAEPSLGRTGNYSWIAWTTASASLLVIGSISAAFFWAATRGRIKQD